MATRIDRLALPKRSLLKFPDRRSVYWLDKVPAKSNSSTTAFDLTPRLSQLSESKKCPYFEDNSRLPEWKVSVAALKACPSDRVSKLALPRLPAAGWQPDRPLPSTISMAVRTARVTPRIRQLACPKKTGRMLTHSSSSSDISLVAPQKTRPSYRTVLLAAPKQDRYRPDRPVAWPVSKSALQAVANQRLHELATPTPRTASDETFDPYRSCPVSVSAHPDISYWTVPNISASIYTRSWRPSRRCTDCNPSVAVIGQFLIVESPLTKTVNQQ